MQKQIEEAMKDISIESLHDEKNYRMKLNSIRSKDYQNTAYETV